MLGLIQNIRLLENVQKITIVLVLRFDNACQKYEFNYSNVEKNLLFEVLFLTSQCFTQFKGCTFSSFLRPCANTQ